MTPSAAPPKEGRTEFAADVPFVRRVLDTDEKASAFNSMFGEKLPSASPKAATGDALLSGYANTWVMDRDFEFIAKRAFDNTLEAYLLKNPIVLLQHDHAKPLGQTYDGGTDDTGLAVESYVRKPQERDPDWKHGAYNDVLAGILRTMSIGGFFYREIVDGEILVVEIDLFEISVVAVPSNPDSIFEATRKAALGIDARSGAGEARVIEQMQQLLGMVPVTDPALAGMPDRFKRAKYYELASEYTKAFEQAPPEYEEWGGIVQKLESGNADAKALQDEVMSFTLRMTPGAKSVNAPVVLSEKAGRVLSKANEGKLRDAVEKAEGAVGNILAVLDKLPAQEEDAVARSLEDLKGAFGQVYNAYELSDTLWDGFWALRTAIENALGVYQQDAVPDTEAAVEACNEFRDWLLSQVQKYGGDEAVRSAMGVDLDVLKAALGDRKAKEAEKHFDASAQPELIIPESALLS